MSVELTPRHYVIVKSYPYEGSDTVGVTTGLEAAFRLVTTKRTAAGANDYDWHIEAWCLDRVIAVVDIADRTTLESFRKDVAAGRKS